MPSRRTQLTVWGVGLAIYLLAVFHRSSLAVAGLEASERFGISAAQLSTFVMLQLLVYAAMQVPVGLMVDRWGSRSVLLTGTALIVVSQAGFALADTYALAVLARIGVGVGDAMTFVCVLRMLSSWFAPRRIPLMTQLTGTLGQSGAIVAAVPMTWALGTVGWTGAYLIAAGASLVVGVVAFLVLSDTPEVRRLRGAPISLTAVRISLTASWAQPGTRLGFWIHFTTQFSSTTMSLLWGYPFLVRGEGRTPAEAGLLLSLIIVAVMASGPLMGWFIGNHPWHRSTLAISVVWGLALTWGAVLLWPGSAPLWLLLLLMVVVGIGGPASMIGFDLGRTSNPSERLASATGLINQGGFVASLVLVVAIGIVLDAFTPGTSTAYSPEAFRWAMSTQYVLWGLGLLQLWRWRRSTRAQIRALGGGPGHVPGTA
ncbi:nitrate/nitrite transporter [Nocardioides sp. CFH 31398]|uniref:MFS transporter n=1 Tax=Nocardioides sp. CFH 31398 TaxID=2919579 RepID=UPI001F0695F4|nr:MFS transporter [Nocardioides sp. CFH 31398]MCH1866716.1 MFS transporter [Nocardioides sp. CFH 31398]